MAYDPVKVETIDERMEKELNIEFSIRKKKIENANKYATIFSISSVILFFFSLLSIYYSSQFQIPMIQLIGVGIGIPLSIFLIILAWAYQYSINQNREEIGILDAKRKIYSVFPPTQLNRRGDNRISYFDRLVKINLFNLSEYYNLVKVHTNNAFRLSAIASVLGFLLVAAGLIIGFVIDSRLQVITYISTGSGIIIELISSIFFYLYNRTIRGFKNYHDGLLSVQNVLIAFKIIEDLKTEKDKVIVANKLIEYLISNKPSQTINQEED